MKAFRLLVFVGFFLKVFADAYAADNNLVVQFLIYPLSSRE